MTIYECEYCLFEDWHTAYFTASQTKAQAWVDKDPLNRLYTEVEVEDVDSDQ